ncbi:MAG: aldehyde dehydrogenase family protein, partial [Deltaproteobacteria bacterium]
MTDDGQAVRARAASVFEAGDVLSTSTLAERALWLSDAASTLARQADGERDALSEATGLSIPMVEWATRTTLETITENAMLALAQNARQGADRALDPIGLLSVVLAGNVFTASVRGIVVPLLFGVPVLVKASSRETLFPAMLRNALRSTDSRLGAAMDVVAFPGGDAEAEAALVELAEAVSVYGSDETIEAIAARLASTPLIAHGHGVSVAYCGSHAVLGAHLGDTISELSLDICAYDQRGCLSPQLVFVEETPDLSAMDFAERLAKEGLEPLSRTLRRGPLPVSVGAAQAQWRGIAEVEGTLFRGDTYSVSVREPQPIRWSPGFRNITVAGVRGLD